MKRNNTHIHRFAGAVLIAAAVAGMAGCGGGGDSGSVYFPPPVAGNPPPNSPPPQDAYDQFIAYVQSLVASALDTAEPADVTAYDPPPTSETKEPVATQ
jgi:hypothetical protein